MVRPSSAWGVWNSAEMAPEGNASMSRLEAPGWRLLVPSWAPTLSKQRITTRPAHPLGLPSQENFWRGDLFVALGLGACKGSDLDFYRLCWKGKWLWMPQRYSSTGCIMRPFRTQNPPLSCFVEALQFPNSLFFFSLSFCFQFSGAGLAALSFPLEEPLVGVSSFLRARSWLCLHKPSCRAQSPLNMVEELLKEKMKGNGELSLCCPRWTVLPLVSL